VLAGVATAAAAAAATGAASTFGALTILGFVAAAMASRSAFSICASSLM